jgi:thioredoxin 1
MQDWSREDLNQFFNEKNSGLIYLYTPLCGTCQMAGKMLLVVAELLPQVVFGKINLNYYPVEAIEWSVESVPCLMIVKDGVLHQKIYAFHSVPYLLETIRKVFI